MFFEPQTFFRVCNHHYTIHRLFLQRLFYPPCGFALTGEVGSLRFHNSLSCPSPTFPPLSPSPGLPFLPSNCEGTCIEAPRQRGTPRFHGRGCPTRTYNLQYNPYNPFSLTRRIAGCAPTRVCRLSFPLFVLCSLSLVSPAQYKWINAILPRPVNKSINTILHPTLQTGYVTGSFSLIVFDAFIVLG